MLATRQASRHVRFLTRKSASLQWCFDRAAHNIGVMPQMDLATMQHWHRFAGQLTAIVSAGLACFSAAAASRAPILTLTTPTAEIVQRIVIAALDTCTARGNKVSVAVVARDGSLLGFLRSPLAAAHTIEVSRRKAYTAATLQAPTSQVLSRTDLSFAPGILLISGGLPLCAAGACLGGVAVAGADPSVDEQCAQAGIDAVKDDLELGEIQ